ncbi:MAG: hypothetical protein FJ146_10635 [Deltaproteobacteria bacterium]|nr:hypothetical protein [Deltaproteobacteria bacterium]
MRQKIEKTIFCLLIAAPTLLAISCGTGGSGGSTGNSGIGQTGSTARFAIAGNVLYTLSTRPKSGPATPPEPSSWQYAVSGDPIIRTFDIATPTIPVMSADVPVQARPETLFSNGNQLFVGTLTGMEMYDLSEPLKPRFLSLVQHVRACDPVVTEGTTAYVTLRSGGGCFNAENVLEIIDFKDPIKPIKLTRFTMNAPFGLAVHDGRAFICDGPAGLRILDVKDQTHIQDLPSVSEEICTDVILNGEHLITTGFTGIAQYDVSQLPPRKLSVIAATDPRSSGTTKSTP